MERLILRQPPNTFERDKYGEYITRVCNSSETPQADSCLQADDAAVQGFKYDPETKNFTDWTVYARRTDRGGKQGIFADIMAGNWQTRFDIVRFAALDRLNEDWEITDVDGRIYDIEAVSAGAQSGGRLMWQVYCVRRKTK